MQSFPIRRVTMRGMSAAARIHLLPAVAIAPAARTACNSAAVTPAAQFARTFTTTTPVLSSDSSATTAAAAATVDGASLFPGLTFQHLQLSYSNTLQTLTVKMNRPELHNAFNEILIGELLSLFTRVSTSSSSSDSDALGSLRAVVLTGAGASFSAGADLNWMKKMKNYSEAENLADSKQLFAMFRAIHSCPVPVIARVNGSALGGGVGLVAACDIAVANKGAVFGLTEVKLGLSPAVISSFVMSKLTPGATNLYFLTGSRFGAAEAQTAGLVQQVAEDEENLDKAVQKLVEELALNSPKAVRATKALIGEIRANPRIDTAETYCTSLIAKLRVSAEGQEGLNSFFEKRKAKWIPAHLGNPKPKKK